MHISDTMLRYQEIGIQFKEYITGRALFPTAPENLYDPCRFALGSGGKYIRPALCLMAAEMFGNLSEDAFHLATAIELFHNFTLVHDDIMDEAPLRRGRPTVYQAYDLSTGILSGDVISIHAYGELARLSPELLVQVLPAFNQTALQVCEGQQLDMDFEVKDEVSVDEYLKMIELKTSVLLASSLRLGALAGGAPADDAGQLYAFGRHLGIAFQLQDDYLDAFGEKSVIGKQPGGDIRSNKKTYLYIVCQQNATDDESKLLDSFRQLPADEKVDRTLQLYDRLKVDVQTRQLINQYYEQSLLCLNAVDLPDEKLQPLKALAGRLLDRKY